MIKAVTITGSKLLFGQVEISVPGYEVVTAEDDFALAFERETLSYFYILDRGGEWELLRCRFAQSFITDSNHDGRYIDGEAPVLRVRKPLGVQVSEII
jgi:hypothetical protein